MDSLRDTDSFEKRKACACVCVCLRSRMRRRTSSIFGFASFRGRRGIEKKRKEVAAIAVEQRTLVRHRLTFHRNPLASSAGGRISRPRRSASAFDGVSIAIRQQRDGNVAFSRAKQQAHSPFSAGAARLRGHSTSRRHRHAEPRATASAPARPPPLRPRELHGALCACAADSATCGAPPPKCRRRRASSTLPRGTPMATIPARIVFSTRHAIGRHVRSAARVPIISSSVLAFSHGPSFSIRPLPPRFLCSTPHGHPFLSSAYFHAPRGVSPFSPRSNFERLRRSRTLYAKPKTRSLARDGLMHSHRYGRSAHDAGGARIASTMVICDVTALIRQV